MPPGRVPPAACRARGRESGSIPTQAWLSQPTGMLAVGEAESLCGSSSDQMCPRVLSALATHVLSKGILAPPCSVQPLWMHRAGLSGQISDSDECAGGWG